MATEDIPKGFLKQARKIALALPEAEEIETWGSPTFRVRKKIFAGIGSGASDGTLSFVPDDLDVVTTMSMKAAPGEQDSLLAIGAPFFKPKYVGSKGWIGIVISEETDWAEVEELIIDSYVTIAPKKLSQGLLSE